MAMKTTAESWFENRPLAKWICGALALSSATLASAQREHSHEVPSCAVADATAARLRLQETEKLFDDGLVSLATLGAMKGASIDAQYCSGQINLATYCRDKGQHLRESLAQYRNLDLRSSIDSREFYTTTLQGLALLRTTCN